jgi:hypothetical protein
MTPGGGGGDQIGQCPRVGGVLGSMGTPAISLGTLQFLHTEPRSRWPKRSLTPGGGAGVESAGVPVLGSTGTPAVSPGTLQNRHPELIMCSLS